VKRAPLILGFLAIACGIGSAQAASSPPPPAKRVPILVYHHIRKNPGWGPNTWSAKMSVSPAGFEKQIQWLDDHGYETVDLTEAAAILQGTQAGPAKPVVLTFDDNNPTQYGIALPILLAHHRTAVFYLITNRLDNKAFITRDKVKEMAADGMDIESHTVTHATLTALSAKKLDAELRESKRVLEELTGKPVLHVAYPSTAHNKTVREHAKAAGYVTGTIMDPRAATSKDDLLKLPRIMMQDSTDLRKILP
jgi:peptidoglycan/xylan/chitin deacetylase (PgdA/CDA1 family)